MTEAIFTLIVSSLTGIFTYLVGRNRKQKEVDSITLANLEKAVEIYNLIIGDLRDEVEKLNKKIDELELKVDTLLSENIQLKQLMNQNANTSTKRN
jgi:peptidoglycan hydrolase CwlO-like protein